MTSTAAHGSNRTIIKQAYEMLVSDRTAFAKKSLGALVTLDKVFELVEGNLSNERRTDIHQVSRRSPFWSCSAGTAAN